MPRRVRFPQEGSWDLREDRHAARHSPDSSISTPSRTSVSWCSCRRDPPQRTSLQSGMLALVLVCASFQALRIVPAQGQTRIPPASSPRGTPSCQSPSSVFGTTFASNLQHFTGIKQIPVVVVVVCQYHVRNLKNPQQVREIF